MPPELALPSSAPLLAGNEPPVPSGSEKDEPILLAPSPAPTAFESPYLTRIAVRSLARIVIVPVQDIVRLEAEDNYVRIWADRAYLHKETLTGLVARLDPNEFLRVHRSHAVNLRLVRDRKGHPAELWVGGTQLLPKEAMLAEARQRYRRAKASAGLPA